MVLLSNASFVSVAYAQVYKCTAQNGKISFSGTPCATANQTEQMVNLKIKPSSMPAPETDWAKENEAFKQRQRDRDMASYSAQNRQNVPAPGAGKNTAATKQMIANCEANHGIDCSKPNVVTQLQRENTPITQQEQQQAIAERRAMQEQAAAYRDANR